MTEKEYYSEKRVSSSSFKWFETSPLLFRKMLDKEIEQEEKRYFEIGKKIHMKILEPNEFDKNYIYLEYDKPKSENQQKFCEDYITYPGRGSEVKAIYAYRKNYQADKLSDDKVKEKAYELKKSLSKYITYLKKRTEYKDILTKTDYDIVNTADSIVRSHIAASKLLFLSAEDQMNGVENYNEQVVFFDFMGVECKSMLDRIVVDHKNKIIKLVDIKTTSDISNFSEHFVEFNYNRQMAFYWLALHNWFKDKNIDITDYTKETYIVCIQKGDLMECRVFQVSEEYLSSGLDSIETLIPIIKWHQDNNSWEHTKDYYLNNGIEIL